MHTNQTILVTGGVGYIGSHTVVELLEHGYNVIIVDNLVNSNIKALERIYQITHKTPIFYPIDLLDEVKLDRVFNEHKIDAVIHFAALKAVGESVVIPLKYYENNICGSIMLFKVMAKHKVKTLVFSSSATVYGDPKTTPITEDFAVQPTNPYGHTKLMVEQLLRDLHQADNSWKIALLRYFNPVGAHQSGLIGEDPNGIPNNLIPYVNQVAVGKLPCLSVFGNDYATVDGTGVRDYIHVVDLANGHLLALKYFEQQTGLITVNLGTGIGYSVLEVISAYEKVSGQKINYKFAKRRSGDVASCYADCNLAHSLLGFKAKYDLLQMCKDSYNWQKQNPNGYE